jgi:hypothetical protein
MEYYTCFWDAGNRARWVFPGENLRINEGYLMCYAHPFGSFSGEKHSTWKL